MDPSQLKTLPDSNLPTESPLEALLQRPVGSGKTREQENKTGLPRPDTGRLPAPCPPAKKFSFADLPSPRYWRRPVDLFDEIPVRDLGVMVTAPDRSGGRRVTRRFEILPGVFLDVDEDALRLDNRSAIEIAMRERQQWLQRQQLQKDTDRMLNEMMLPSGYIETAPGNLRSPRAGRRCCQCGNPRCGTGPFTGPWIEG